MKGSSIHKTSKSTLVYQTVNVREPLYQIYTMKVQLLLRLMNKKLTNNLVHEIYA